MVQFSCDEVVVAQYWITRVSEIRLGRDESVGRIGSPGPSTPRNVRRKKRRPGEDDRIHRRLLWKRGTRKMRAGAHKSKEQEYDMAVWECPRE